MRMAGRLGSLEKRLTDRNVCPTHHAESAIAIMVVSNRKGTTIQK
jgi:hypothetical protein